MTTGEPARRARRDEAAGHAEPARAARPSTSRRRRRRSRSRSAPTSPRCPRPASSPRRWSRSCSPPRRCASSAATRSTSSLRNHAAYIASLRVDVSDDDAASPPRARRADGRGEDARSARRCATRLDRPFVDTDDARRGRTPGMTVAEIFAHRGRGRVPRARARRRSPTSCASPAPLVIACGGGAVLDADNRRRAPCTRGVVVWLQRRRRRRSAARVGPATEAGPLLDGRRRTVATLERLAVAARAAYEAAARRAGRHRRPHRRRGRRRRARGVPHVERVTVARRCRPTTSSSARARSRELGALLAGRRRVAVVSQPGVADFHGAALTAALARAPASSTDAVPHRRRRGREDARHRRAARAAARGVGPAARRRRRRARRRRGRRHRRLRGRRLPPRRRRACRRRPRCSRRSTPRSAARPR